MNTKKLFKNRIEPRGYIALMATIVISLILLVMVAQEGLSGWFSRFVVLGTEAKEQATALAEGCSDQALSALITDLSYRGDSTSTITMPDGSTGTCHVFPTEFNNPSAGFVSIKTQAVVRDAFANLDIAMDFNNIHLDSTPADPLYGKLIVQTIVVNNATSKVPSDFTMHVSGIGATPSTFAGSGTGAVVTLSAGAFSVSADPVAGFSQTASSGCTGVIAGGQIKSCIITETAVTTTLTLIANVVNDNGGGHSPVDFLLFIDGTPATLGQVYTVSAGAHTASATGLLGYTASPWGYHCASGGGVTVNLGDNRLCVINFDDNPPPAPICAESVMILDRSGSMSSADLTGERNAANALVSLYAGVLPPLPLPRLGVGSFGAYPNQSLPAGAASVPASGQLTTLYSNLTTVIGQITGSNSSVGSNLAAAITAGLNEITAHGTSGKQKVIILVSDGVPNQPSSGGTAANTGFLSPTTNAQDAGGELWSNPNNAHTDGGGDASDPVSENDQHRFYNFGFGGGAGLPSGSTVTGMEVSADAWATAPGATSTLNSAKSPSAAVAPNQWTNPTRASASDDSYATNATNGQQQAWGNFGFAIPAGAIVQGVLVTTEAKITGSGGGSLSTATLLPNGQGSDNNWNGDEGDVDESGTPDCSSSDRIDSNNSGNRESVNIDLSSVPNGSVVTSVQVLTWDQGNSGGQYQDFVSVGGARTNSPTITVTSTSGCIARTQTIDIPDFTKSGSSDVDVGVQKVGNTEARIGAIRAIVTYTPAASGSLGVSLSSNNGGVWTAAKSVAISSAEGVATPSGNSSSDLWSRTWTPADFNDGNFALRVQNNSTTGSTVSLDQVIVTVYYAAPVPGAVACQLGVDLSWNAGTSWSNEKTQTLTGTETAYTLGASNDDWTSSHTWVPTDFSNTNFRARVRATDPGAACSDSAVEHLDWLQVKAHYTVPASPTQAALNAADNAKLASTTIFTIHFGDTAGRNLLAQLASGSTPVSGHQPGSFNDPTGVVNGDTGLISPSVQASDTGGDGNGFEVSPVNALTDGPSGLTGAARNMDGPGDRHRFSGYNIALPPNATIVGIQTRLDWWLDSTSGTNSMNVELSWNGGANWTSAKSATTESTNTGNSETEGSGSDTWGRTWTAADFDNANFRVRVTSNSTTATRDFFLDWVPVRVYYTVIQENGDGDDFFIAPSSADMKGIFEFIGNQVCPAASNPVATPPPTTANLLVITRTTNNEPSPNTGTLNSGDFTAAVTGGNPAPASFAGSESGVLVTIDPGNFNVTQGSKQGYVQSRTDTCSSGGDGGSLIAGETRVCVLTNDDLPPPPPPPDLTIDPGTWHETPTGP